MRSRIIATIGPASDHVDTLAEMMQAGMNADRLFITSDNPRTENPDSIIKDMLRSCKQARRIEIEKDRKKAIENAIQSAMTGE